MTDLIGPKAPGPTHPTPFRASGDRLLDGNGMIVAVLTDFVADLGLFGEIVKAVNEYYGDTGTQTLQNRFRPSDRNDLTEYLEGLVTFWCDRAAELERENGDLKTSYDVKKFLLESSIGKRKEDAERIQELEQENANLLDIQKSERKKADEAKAYISELEAMCSSWRKAAYRENLKNEETWEDVRAAAIARGRVTEEGIAAAKAEQETVTDPDGRVFAVGQRVTYYDDPALHGTILGFPWGRFRVLWDEDENEFGPNGKWEANELSVDLRRVYSGDVEPDVPIDTRLKNAHGEVWYAGIDGDWFLYNDRGEQIESEFWIDRSEEGPWVEVLEGDK